MLLPTSSEFYQAFIFSLPFNKAVFGVSANVPSIKEVFAKQKFG